MKAHQQTPAVPEEPTEEIIIEFDDNDVCRLDDVASKSGVPMDTLATVLVKLFIQEKKLQEHAQGS